jgi:hypothetical protein
MKTLMMETEKNIPTGMTNMARRWACNQYESAVLGDDDPPIGPSNPNPPKPPPK